MSGLREDQIRRYSRQILLREVGGRGQRRLLDAAVAVIGLGPVGAACAAYLAAAGVGRLLLVDARAVGVNDLGAGALYPSSALGQPRAEAAAAALAARHPDVACLDRASSVDLAVYCGGAPGQVPSACSLWAGLSEGAALVSGAPQPLDEESGLLGPALSLAAGSLAAAEALRELLGQPSPLRSSRARLDLFNATFTRESL